MEYALQLIYAAVGTVAFALLFQVRREKLFLAGLGGLLAWGVYLLMGLVVTEDVPRYFVASAALAVYAEVLARVVKCPATLFLVTASVPLIPGGSLYATMRYFMEGDLSASAAQGLNTLMLAIAIAVGMLFPMSISQLLRSSQEKRESAPPIQSQREKTP